jgi:hypothetical protein
MVGKLYVWWASCTSGGLAVRMAGKLYILCVYKNQGVTISMVFTKFKDHRMWNFMSNLTFLGHISTGLHFDRFFSQYFSMCSKTELKIMECGNSLSA